MSALAGASMTRGKDTIGTLCRPMHFYHTADLTDHHHMLFVRITVDETSIDYKCAHYFVNRVDVDGRL